MALREEAKQQNRDKIKEAAAKIIRKEGMGKLTMRHLAEVAGVSLRTPYNLFGSKTEVLVALLDDAAGAIGEAIQLDESHSILEGLITSIVRMQNFFAADEDFFRDVYWGIMSSDQVETRKASYDQLIVLIQDIVAKAVDEGELRPQTDPQMLGESAAIQLMAILGMWGSGYFTNEECARQIQIAWTSLFLANAVKKPQRFLAAAHEKHLTAAS